MIDEKDEEKFQQVFLYVLGKIGSIPGVVKTVLIDRYNIVC
jgi:hypothetical protein